MVYKSGFQKKKKILIMFCPFVNWSVILYWAEFPIFLFNEEKVGGIRAPRFVYGFSLQVFLDKVVDFLDFFLVEG